MSTEVVVVHFMRRSEQPSEQVQNLHGLNHDDNEQLNPNPYPRKWWAGGLRGPVAEGDVPLNWEFETRCCV